MMVRTSVMVSGCSSIVMMNERSILSMSTGSFARYASEEWPVPKSSIATPTPKARSAFSFSMLSATEAAWRKAKETGDRCLFYTQRMSQAVAENLSLENKLRLALERNEFVLHYQPKVDLETRGIVGVEALIRWQSPELGLVPPMQFIPLMEETG